MAAAMGGGGPMLQAPIILLREGVDASQGLPQIVSNINVCQSIVALVKTTLGPRGMDKLMHDANGKVTITNDGATVLDLLNVVHPAGRLLVDIAKAQDDEVGDGTTSVVILAGELLAVAKSFLDEGMAPRVIIAGYRQGCDMAVEELTKNVQIDLARVAAGAAGGPTGGTAGGAGGGADTAGAVTTGAAAPGAAASGAAASGAAASGGALALRPLYEKCAQTCLNSKLLSGYKELFAKMVVDAVLTLDGDLDMKLIGIKKIPGGSVTESQLVQGVAFKKTFSYAGFEQQPKYFKNARVLLLNIELEHKAEKENAEVRVSSPEEYLAIVDAEWKIIYDRLEKIAATGANVVFSRLAIGDLATQFFAGRGIFCAGRVEDADMQRTRRATGATVLTSLAGDPAAGLGFCGEFEELQLGADRYNVLRDCPKTKTVTFLLRGGALQFIEEAARSLNDAIMIVRRTVKTAAVVPGGGAVEMQLSKRLREATRSASGRRQLVLEGFARALEVIPRTLAQNSGFDPCDILNLLRQKHNGASEDGCFEAVNCLDGGTFNAFENFVWEPAVVKLHALRAATEAACAILAIDETIKNPKSTREPDGPAAMAAPRRR